MDKKPLIGVSICAVVLLVLGSLSNVVGYQTVQSSNQIVIKERINQREWLFQTIVDIANNKEIQRIILKSQMSRGIFLTSEIPVVTKQQLRQMYFIGMILSKIISTSRVQSIIGKYQFNSQNIRKEIGAIIEENFTLKEEISQVKDSECDCKNENNAIWHFSIICDILHSLFILFIYIIALMILFSMLNMMNLLEFFLYIILIIVNISQRLECKWLTYPPPFPP